MEAITGIIALFVVLIVGLTITRVATCALTFTGVSRELARFQARSAFTGCGFTTMESEQIVGHPVRRRIIMILMVMGNGVVVLAITSLVPVMVSIQDSAGDRFAAVAYRLLWLALGLCLLWMIARSTWLDQQMFRIIGWALKRFTRIEVRDYSGLLHLQDGYAVREVEMDPGDWMVGKNLAEVRLGDEGVQVLGIRRADGTYIGSPTGVTFIRSGDEIILYGQSEHLAELERRRADAAGDRAHRERIEQQQQIIQEQTEQDSRGPRSGPGEADGPENGPDA